MSAADLIHDLALDEYAERRKLLLEYHEASAAMTQCRIQVDTWERRELAAKQRQRKAVKALQARGWSIP